VSDLLKQAQDAVQQALDAGAQGAWARASRSRAVEFDDRDGELEKVQESTSRSLGLSLYVDGRYSTHSTTSLKADRVASFVQEAVELTRALQPDEHRQLPDPALFEGRSDADLQIVDGGVGDLPADQRKQWLAEMNEAGHGHEAVISVGSSVSTSHGDGAAASSNGFAGTWEGTSCWIGCGITVRGEGDSKPEGGMWIGGRRLEQLYSAKQVATEALQRATDRLGSTKGPTAKTTMVVDPTVAGSLVRRLLGSANARSIAQGRSFWGDLVGKQVLPEMLTITDRPLLPGGLASRHFDGEGIAARDLAIIEGGVVQNLFVDTYYGRKTGMAPTTGGSSNLIVSSGVDKGLSDLIADAGEGVYVTSWLGGNADGTTGDFSLGIRGHLISNGQVGAPVGEMNITGNLLELFGQLAAIGNDAWPYRSTQVPTLVFEGVQFSGA
jgi:PmbA protein